jgi:DNA modification methylase
MSLPPPFHVDERAGIALFHGDARELLAAVDPRDVAAIVSDPPYGIDVAENRATHSRRVPKRRHADACDWDREPFDPAAILALGKPVVLWGADNYRERLPAGGCFLPWDKATRNGLDLRHSEFEFAWTNARTRSVGFRHLWSGAFRDTERGTHYHPCQKPVALMEWCISLVTSEGETVLDPYAGAGPTLIAAKRSRRRAIGFEIDVEHCRTAVRRLQSEPSPLY